jgi:hypothetical protein
MIPNLHLLLLDRLQQQGVNADEASALLRDLFKILLSNLGTNPAELNPKLHLLGWFKWSWTISRCSWRWRQNRVMVSFRFYVRLFCDII